MDRSRLPAWLLRPLRAMRTALRKFRYRGNARFCPVCRRSSRRFMRAGVVRRDDARCIHCGALERDRLSWLFLTTRTDLFDDGAKKMLHIAPERCFESRLKDRLGEDYLTADLFDPRAMVRMDITDIELADESFDVVYCSHVLEHVQDDRAAMKELFRVLKRTGWAILNVPITDDHTFEDPSIVDPEERLRVFGQRDHVRRYGPDYIERLREAGFTVEVTGVADLTTEGEAVRMGLTSASGEIHFCTKVLGA
jgi:SAM-dependent methyltransferase